MALLSGAGEVYTLSGAAGVGLQNREDLQDFITNISPTETPFISGIGQTQASAVQHEWLEHSLAAATNTTAVVEGNESAFATPTTLTRTVNVTQINEKTVAISGTQDRVNKAGMGTELAYRVMLLTKEIKRDMETTALQNTAGDYNTGATNAARRCKGFEAFVTTNTSQIVATTSTASDVVTAVNSELSNVWTAGGNPDTILCNAANKQLLSSATTGVTKNLDANDRRFVNAIDVYESDFGIMKVIPDRFDNTQSWKLIESGLWKMATLRPLTVAPLAKSGDTTKRLLNIEWTLECRAENGNGMVTNDG